MGFCKGWAHITPSVGQQCSSSRTGRCAREGNADGTGMGGGAGTENAPLTDESRAHPPESWPSVCTDRWGHGCAPQSGLIYATSVINASPVKAFHVFLIPRNLLFSLYAYMCICHYSRFFHVSISSFMYSIPFTNFVFTPPSVFGCTGSSLCVQASHHGASSGCRAPALGSRVWELRFTGLVTPQHVGSSGTRDQTHVPCMGRWILNHWTTREILSFYWVTNMLNSEAIQKSKIHCLLSRISAE